MASEKHSEKVAINYSVTRNSLVRVMPKAVLNIGIKALCLETDMIDFLFGRRGDLTPPCKMRIQIGPFVDPRYYEANAKEFFGYMKNLCTLKPNAKLLDVGCGYGQLVAPLSKYLNSNGAYEGFDIVDTMIEWCRKKISSKYPNFHFQFADVFNKQYNPKGKQKASEYQFPYEDKIFDFVFLKSVFTHMLPSDMSNYLSEISRVMKKDGRCLISYFLLNSETLELINANLSPLDFRYALGSCRVNDMANPEIAVAYEEKQIQSLYRRLGLEIVRPVSYGSWCGRKTYLSYQDIIVASKK